MMRAPMVTMKAISARCRKRKGWQVGSASNQLVLFCYVGALWLCFTLMHGALGSRLQHTPCTPCCIALTSLHSALPAHSSAPPIDHLAGPGDEGVTAEGYTDRNMSTCHHNADEAPTSPEVPQMYGGKPSRCWSPLAVCKTT